MLWRLSVCFKHLMGKLSLYYHYPIISLKATLLFQLQYSCNLVAEGGYFL